MYPIQLFAGSASQELFIFDVARFLVRDRSSVGLNVSKVTILQLKIYWREVEFLLRILLNKE
ncbi:MAG: hypothetical protein F6J92_19775 [Symploca sp. SIO1A3]|nr:hypothetical protein [Symploca sp. SIO1A3]